MGRLRGVPLARWGGRGRWGRCAQWGRRSGEGRRAWWGRSAWRDRSAWRARLRGRARGGPGRGGRRLVGPRLDDRRTEGRAMAVRRAGGWGPAGRRRTGRGPRGGPVTGDRWRSRASRGRWTGVGSVGTARVGRARPCPVAFAVAARPYRNPGVGAEPGASAVSYRPSAARPAPAAPTRPVRRGCPRRRTARHRPPRRVPGRPLPRPRRRTTAATSRLRGSARLPADSWAVLSLRDHARNRARKSVHRAAGLLRVTGRGTSAGGAGQGWPGGADDRGRRPVRPAAASV